VMHNISSTVYKKLLKMAETSINNPYPSFLAPIYWRFDYFARSNHG